MRDQLAKVKEFLESFEGHIMGEPKTGIPDDLAMHAGLFENALKEYHQTVETHWRSRS